MPTSRTRLALVAMMVSSSTTSGVTFLQENTTAASASYSLIAEYSGSTFFDHFTPFTDPDPTHGDVVYVDMETAQADGLVRFTNGSGTPHAIIGVDHTSVAPSGRNSVRLTSKQTFQPNTLSILDVRHIPVQWGVWPAVWFLGDLPDGTWPASNGGESDWLEWVHKSPYNSMTLHTGPGCSVLNSSSSSFFQGTLLNPNCNAGQGSQGCSIAAYTGDSSSSSSHAPTAGDAFNAAGGAIYAHLWTPAGVTIWMFPHDRVPADLGAGTPDPEAWSATYPPLARFGGSGCDFTRALQDLQLVINIDFCGDWAGQPEIWASSGAQAATGASTCTEFVSGNPQAFEDTYFEIAALKFYSSAAGTVNEEREEKRMGKGNQTKVEVRTQSGSVIYANASGDPVVFSNQTKMVKTRVNSDSIVYANASGDPVVLANSTLAARWAPRMTQQCAHPEELERLRKSEAWMRTGLVSLSVFLALNSSMAVTLFLLRMRTKSRSVISWSQMSERNL